MLTKKKKKEIGRQSALKQWGLRVVMSVFPIKNGNYKVTIKYQGKIYTVVGKDRENVLNSAFKRWETLIEETLT